MNRKMTDTEKGRLTLIIAISLALIITVTASALSKRNALKATDEWGDEDLIGDSVETVEQITEDPNGEFSAPSVSEEEITLDEVEESSGMASQSYEVFVGLSDEEKLTFLANLSANDKDLLLRYIAMMEYSSYYQMSEEDKSRYLSVYSPDEAAALLNYFAEEQNKSNEVSYDEAQGENAQDGNGEVVIDMDQAQDLFQTYSNLPDSEKQTFLDNLTPEQQFMIIDYIDTMSTVSDNEPENADSEFEQAEIETEIADAEPEQTAVSNSSEVVLEQTEDLELVDVPLMTASAESEEVELIEEQDTTEDKEQLEQTEDIEDTEESSEDKKDSEEETEDKDKKESEEAEDKEKEESKESEDKEKEESAETEKENAETDKTVKIWYAYDGEPRYGMTVTIESSISGYSDNVKYTWLYSADGETWETVDGGNSASYSFVLDRTNANYRWRLNVEDVK